MKWLLQLITVMATVTITFAVQRNFHHIQRIVDGQKFECRRNVILFAKRRRTTIGEENRKYDNMTQGTTEGIKLPDTLVVQRRGIPIELLDSSQSSYSPFRSVENQESLISTDKLSELKIFQTNFKDDNSFTTADKNSSSSDSVIDKIKDLIGTILIADFFLIIFFLLWFLAAAASQSSYPVVLERFQDIFQPIVVPCLTLLMVGSIASGPLGKKSISEK